MKNGAFCVFGILRRGILCQFYTQQRSFINYALRRIYLLMTTWRISCSTRLRMFSM